jgi:hypothetical protein
LLDRNSTVTDPDSSNFATGVLTIAISAGAQATDVLSFKPSGSGATLVAINGNQVLVGGILIGTLTGGTNKTPLAVTFNSSATPTRVQNLLRSLAFSNTSSNPPTAARTMRITLSDGAGGTSAAVTKKIQIGL